LTFLSNDPKKILSAIKLSNSCTLDEERQIIRPNFIPIKNTIISKNIDPTIATEF
jgi:hypothetical protein